MKIEKINENQIRCTLTREDLADRHLKISELAYGSEKAKSLFRDMMQQANYEFGFETDDLPLMIEAVPLSPDTILLIITKVEYPEELDTRFSKFSEPDEDAYPEYSPSPSNDLQSSADDILELFDGKKHSDASSNAPKEMPASPASMSKTQSDSAADKSVSDISPVSDLVKLFSFRSLDQLTALARVLKGYYDEENTLYKDSDSKCLYLVLRKGHHSPEEFNKICNILSEYAVTLKYTTAIGAHFKEHLRVLIADCALQVLADL
ncbi:MAG: adaptor protein MecA [Roseburia sp.]